MNEAYYNIGGDPVYSDDAIAITQAGTDPLLYPNTDWLDLLWKDQTLQNHSLSISGGNNIARFAVTGNFLLQDGFLDNYKYERFNLRANTTVNLRDNISVDVDLNMIRSSQHQPSVADSGGQSPLYQLYGILLQL